MRHRIPLSLAAVVIASSAVVACSRDTTGPQVSPAAAHDGGGGTAPADSTCRSGTLGPGGARC